MASLFSTGPLNIFVAYGAAAPVFLGHGERAPKIDVRPRYAPVTCDLGGEEPIDDLQSGESGSVQVELIRWNYPLLNSLKSRTRAPAFPASVAGAQAPGELGTLMVTEGAAYQLFLQFTRAGNPVFGAAGAGGAMPAGYRFAAAFLDPESVTSGAASAHKYSLTWKCLRTFSPATSALGVGNFLLYDYNMAAIAGVAVN